MSVLAINGGSPVREKPFPGWPVWDGAEVEAVKTVIESGKWGMAQGDRVKTLEAEFAAYQNAKFGIAATSGSTALRAALLALDIPAGSEVIVPAYTFVASATIVLECNCVPVFADIDPETYTLDPDSFAAMITEKTRAVMPVHLAGLPCDMDRIMEIARRRDIKVIEDACQAWGSSYKGKRVGAIGDIGCFSFQSSKHITAGEGGMTVTNDPLLAERTASIVNCGRMAGGQWHEHKILGGNYRLSELHAAVILVQLARYDEMLKKRNAAVKYLTEKINARGAVGTISVPDYVSEWSCHFFSLKYDPDKFGGLPKASFIKALNAEGVKPAHGGYYIPIYDQPFLLEKNVGMYDRICRHQFRGKPLDYSEFDCPVTAKACASEAVWILQSLLLADKDDLADIVAAVEKLAANYRELL